MLEIEIAFIFGKDVTYPITLEDLPTAIDKVTPAVELPDLFFKNLNNLDWKDLIALNVAARRVIIGDAINSGSISPH